MFTVCVLAVLTFEINVVYRAGTASTPAMQTRRTTGYPVTRTSFV